MKARFEYVALTILILIGAGLGVHHMAGAVAASLNESAARIAAVTGR